MIRDPKFGYDLFEREIIISSETPWMIVLYWTAGAALTLGVMNLAVDWGFFIYLLFIKSTK